MKRLPVHVLFVVVFLACLLVALSGHNPPVRAQNGSPANQADVTVGQSSNAPRVDRYRPENIVITAHEDGFEATWSTQRPTSATILYGTSISEMTSSVPSTYPRGTAHQVSVGGLEAYRVYYFTIETSHGRYGVNGSPFKLITDPSQNAPPIQTAERLSGDFQSPPLVEAADAVESETNAETLPGSAADPRPVQELPPLSADAVLSDGQFVFGPNVDGFDAASYIAQNMPALAPHTRDIEQSAAVYSINPRVLLTMIELGLVTPGGSDSDAAARSAAPRADFPAQLDRVALAMFNAYYQHLRDVSPRALGARNIAPITLQNGAEIFVAPDTNAGSYAILSAIGAGAASPDEFTALAGATEAGGFLQTYRRLFPGDDPLSQANQIMIPGSTDATPPVGLFQLPYQVGQAWRFNGIHGPTGPVPPYSSIDFWPVTNSFTTYWNTVNAATSGTFNRTPTWSTCQVEVKDASGWSAVYYHLEGIPSSLANGTFVAKNTQIGLRADTEAEAECHGGDWGNISHVHFTLKYNGAYQDLNGASLAGWTVNRGSATAYSCTSLTFTKGTATRTCGSWTLNHPDGDNNTIASGQTYSGAIAPNYDSDRYSFYGQQGQQVQIWMTRVDSSALDSYVRLYDSTDVLVTYDDDSAGSFNSYINFTLPKTDTYQIIGTSYYNGSGGSYQLKLQLTTPSLCTPNSDQVALFIDDNYLGSCVVKNIGVYPTVASIGLPNDSVSSVKVGSNVRLRLFDNEYYTGPNSTFYSNDAVLSNDAIGNDKVSSLRVEKRYAANLALNRPAWASSVESSSTPAYLANDGNTGTRWSSKHSSTNVTEQWRVDLGSVQMFDQVKIRWEAAYAATYFIGWSNDAVNYTGYNVSVSAPGDYTYWLNQRSARYVIVIMYTHAPCCANFSIWETEVYSTTRAAIKSGEYLSPTNGLDNPQVVQPVGELTTIQIPPTE